jgi:hypothetical protein
MELIVHIERKAKLKNARHMERKKIKWAHQKKGPLNHNLSTISHDYGHIILYLVIYKPLFNIILT